MSAISSSQEDQEEVKEIRKPKNVTMLLKPVTKKQIIVN
jgi:hypothetical protein